MLDRAIHQYLLGVETGVLIHPSGNSGKRVRLTSGDSRVHSCQTGAMTKGLHIALYQPDIAGNTGTILRTAACLGFHVHIIEPTGFDLSDRNLKRAGMDYLEMAALTRHVDWQAFQAWRHQQNMRLVLLTTKTDTAYTAHTHQVNDIYLFGRESAGVPESVHKEADVSLTIPMHPDARSLNLAISVAMVASEMLRQSG